MRHVFGGTRERTCISTLCPSPLYPSNIAVTTTNCSFATKFRTHRSYLAASWEETGWRSNLSAAARGRRKSSTQLKSRDNRSMIVCVVVDQLEIGVGSASRIVQVSHLAGRGRGARLGLGGEGVRDPGCVVAFTTTSLLLRSRLHYH